MSRVACAISSNSISRVWSCVDPVRGDAQVYVQRTGHVQEWV